MPNEEDRKWLYAQFKDNGYDTGSYDDFISSLDNDEDFEWWHNEATSLGLEVGDLDEFGSLFRTPKQSQNAPKAEISATEPEGDVPESFGDQPDLRALNEDARKSAEKEQKRIQKEDAKAQKKAQKAVSAERKAYAAMSPQERRKAFNEQFQKRQAEYAAADPEGWAEEQELIAENDQLAREAIREEKKQKEEQKRYGAGNEAYSPEEAAAAGKEFEALAPEIDQFDTRLAAFNNKSELVNSGRLQLTPDEYAEMQAEADALTGIVNRYENLINTAPGREYKAVSERLDALSKGEKTPENAWEYAQEFSKLQRNPLYRASMGQMAPSEDEIQSDLLQGQIAYLEGKMKDAKGKDRKELKKAYSEAKEALYANPYYKEHLATKIAENKAENEQIGLQRAEYVQQLREGYAEKNIDPNYYWQMEKGDPELQRLDAAAHMHDDAIREYQKPTKYEAYNKNVTSGSKGWAEEMATNPFGMVGFAEDVAVVRPVLEKVQELVGNLDQDEIITQGKMKDLEEQLTPGELAVLDAWFEKVGAQAAVGADTAIGYQIGQGIGDMVNLGIEMVLTGGVGGAVHKGIDKAGMAAMKRLLSKRAYAKLARSGAGRVALWGTHKVVRDVAETAVRIPFMPSTYKALGEGSVELSSDYKVRPLTEYAPEKLFDQYVEQLTEVSNGFGLPVINRVVKTPGMTKFIHGMLGENGTRALRAFIERGDIKLLDDAMIGSFGGEWEEELLGAVIHSITDDPTALRDFFSAEQQLVLLGTLAPLPITRGAVGGVALGVPAAKAGISWNRAEKALFDAGFDEGRIARLKEVMDNAPAPEAARAVMEAYNDAYEGLMAVEEQDDIVRGSLREARLAGGLYDKLAHYYWDAQQKRAVGLMAEVENDRKVRDKQAELKAQYGQFWYEDAAGNPVVERASMVNPAGGETQIFLTSNKYNSNDELPYVAEDGSTGFVNEGQFVREDPLQPATPLNEYLARLVMQDSQVEEAAQVINEATAVNQTLRQQVESLQEVTFDGKPGHLTNPGDDMVTFVPDDESEENIIVSWETLAEQNGIGVPEVSTQDEKTIQDADVIAAREQAKADIYDSVNEALNGGFDEAVVDTEDGPANVVGILQDTIDPDEGTAQFVVQFPDGKRDVTSSIPIEPILNQLNGEANDEVAEEPETEPEAEPEEEPEEEEPKFPLDKDGNPIYDAPGVSVEDALEDMYSYTEKGLDESDIDESIINKANEAEKGRAVKQGKMSLKEWAEKKKEANRVADFWAQMKEYAEENKREREAEEKREAERQALIDEYGVDVSSFDLTPQTLQEAVADYLGGVHIINLDDALKHIQTRKKNGGIPAELIRHMGPYGIIASKGGSTVADVASDIVREFYGDLEHDDLQDEAFDYIVDFVRGNTKSEIKEFIFNQRLDAARKLAEIPMEEPKEEPAAPAPQPAPAPAPEPAPEPVEEPEEDLPEEAEEPEPAPAPETEVQEPEKEEGKGEEKPENVGKTGGKSVPLGEGEDVPATEREIRTADEAKAFYEKQYGKGSARAINKAKLWEKLHAHDVKPSTNGQNKMALAIPEGYTEDEVNEIINLGAQEGKYLVEEDGKVKFPQFFKSLVESYGDVIRPFVKQIYGSTGMIVDEEFADQMDERKAVRAFDENTDLNDIDDEQSIDSVRDADGRDSTPVPPGDEGGVGEEGGSTDVPSDTGTPGENTEGSGDATDNGEDQGGEGEGRPADDGADSGEETEPVAGTVGGRGRKTDGSRGRGGKRGGTNGRGRGGKRTGGTESGEVGGTEPGLQEGVTEEKENTEETRETARAEKEKSVNEETDTDKLETEKDSIKEKLSGLEEAEENAAERAKLAGELEAVIARLRELYKNAPKKLDTLEKEKVPYVSVSDPSGEHSIGSVVPSGVAEAMHTAMLRIEKEIGKPLAEFVREELHYKSLDEMFSKDGKDEGLAGEQVDAVALSIYQMKKGRMFINGDMTGIGKGRVGAALIRWAKLNGKKCIFASDKPSLFTDMYRDITDIGSGYKSEKDPGLLPFIINDKDPRNKNKTVTILNSEKKEMVTSPSKSVKQKVFEGDGKSLPVVGESINRERSGPKGGPQFRGKQYDFVMMTYSQAQAARGAFAKSKLEWLKSYAKDAIIICDESHLAAGDSSRGSYFQDMVRDCGGVTFMSATFAKNPQCMKLYAIKSSMGDARMSNQAFIETVEKYGVPMQEFLAQTLIEAGEMVRRERDFTGVKTTWTDPKELYSEEEYKNYRYTNDKTVELIRSIIQFQRTFIDPIIGEMNGPLKAKNQEAEEAGEGWFYSYTNTAYSSQVSNICNLMFYAMKAKKAADVAIEQMKRGEKSVIVVDNTLEGYIKQIEGIVEEPDFTAVFERGMKTILKYRFNKKWKKLDREESEEKGEPVWIEDEDKAEVQEFESIRPSFNEAQEQAYVNLLETVRDYAKDKSITKLTISPIDYIKDLIAEAGFSCGEITGRKVQLVNGGGMYQVKPRETEGKDTEYRFNGGTAKNPLPANEQYDALIINSAAATGISLHSSRRFGNRAKRNEIIVQPAKDQNVEVQVRGRIDRTGQVERGSYIYITSPIPAEYKTVMMLRKKLASLDAQASGTADVSSNKVDADDMDNKYGDEVARDFLAEHPEINNQLDNPIAREKDKNSGEMIWKGRDGLLYQLLIGMQRMTCDEQEMILKNLQEQYVELVEYYEQNGTNELSTAVLDLDAVTIDEGVFVHGKDNSSISGFAHDTKLERIEANILKKPMASEQIYDKMRQLGAFTEEGKIDPLYGEKIVISTESFANDKKAELKAKHENELRELLQTIREATPQGELSDSDYEKNLMSMIPVVEMRERHKTEEEQTGENLDLQVARVRIATNNLKPGALMMVPLIDGAPKSVPYGPGRFIGFKVPKDSNPKGVKAMFATKDSRSSIDIPVVKMKDMIVELVHQTEGSGNLYDQNLRDIGGSRFNTYITDEDRRAARDEWWDKRIPKNKGRSIRYIITGNLFQAGYNLGTQKKKDKNGREEKSESVRGKMCLFTKKDAETGRVTVEQGMLLVDSFDPETFYVSDVVKKPDIWDSYDSVNDNKSNITAFRSGNNLILQFYKRRNEKIAKHPVFKDEVLKGMMNEKDFVRTKDYIQCSIPDGKVDEALEHVYKEYGFTKDHLFIMPDSTERVDAIVPDTRPYKEIIDEYNEKYPYYYASWQLENKIKELIARHKADIENEDVIKQIKDLVAYRQAMYRKDYARRDTGRLAWEALIQQGEFEKNTEDKAARDTAYNKLEAIKAEMASRLGDITKNGTLKHYKQGRHAIKEIEDIFNEFNKDKFNKEMAAKIFKKFKSIKEANIPIVFSEKIDNGTGGFSQGQLVEYNWKFYNADWISDQQKANTALHELVHTMTVYAKKAVDDGLGHLINDDMNAIVNELMMIYRCIYRDSAFIHDTYPDYGTTDWEEMLAEAGSNPVFREDLKKVRLIKTVRDGDVSFSKVSEGQDLTGKKVISAYDAVIDRLNELIDGFNETALMEVYRGTRQGEMNYRGRGTENLRNPIDRAKAIVTIDGIAKKLGVQFEQDSSLKAKGAFSPSTGKIRINIDAHKDTADLEATLLHEAVAHYGLRKLFGDDWKELRKRLYDQATDGIRKRVDEIAKANGLSTEVAMEEYIASLAEDGRFDQQEESFWQKVVTGLKRLLHKIGFHADWINDADLRAMLYASYRNLQRGGALESAARISTYSALRSVADNSRNNANFVDNGTENDRAGTSQSPDGIRGNGRGLSARETSRLEAEADRSDIRMLEAEVAPERIEYRGDSEGAFDRRVDQERESRRLIEAAKQNGLFIEPGTYDDLPRFAKASKESIVRLDEQNGRVIKIKDPFAAESMTHNSPFDELYVHLAHNIFFPESRYKFLGITTNRRGDEVRFVLQQDYIASIDRVDDVDAQNFVRNHGFRKIDGYRSENDDVIVMDYYGSNILQDADGYLHLIDPLITFKRNPREVIDDYLNGDYDPTDPEFLNRFLGEEGARNLDESQDYEDVRNLEIEQETEELYRRSSQEATAQTAAQMYGGQVRTIGSAVHEVLVDELHPVDVLLDALSTESKTEIKDDERVSDRIRETGGKAMHAIRQYDKKFLQPMWSAVGEFRKNTGTSIKDTETYIGLKSGLERNVVLAKRDAKRDYQSQYDATAGEIDGQIKKIDSDLKRKIKALDKQLAEGKISDTTHQGKVDALNAEAKTQKDKLQAEKDAATAKRDGHFADVDSGTDERYQKYRKNDYSAITAWAETDDLEEAEALAGDYVADMESRAGAETTKELWKRINAATKETLKFQYEHDMLTRQQYTDISKMMQYYVPMRGFAENTAEDIYNYYVTPQGNDFQATVLTAKGRKTWYEGPLGNIGAMHSSAISQGIKNEAKLSLLDAVRRRPDNTIATVTRAWFVKNGQKDANGKDLYDVAYPQIPENVSFTQRQAIVDQFEKDMAEKKANGEAYNSHREVDLRGGVVAFERDSHRNEHIVKVREGGKEYGVIINGNPAAAQAINGVKHGPGAGNKFLNGMRTWTRFLSSMFTTFSVPFWVSNFQRDHGQGLTNAFIRNNPAYVGNYIINRLKCFKLFPYIIGEESLEKAVAGGDRVATLYKQYLENGGPMGQNRIEDNEYFERKMRRFLNNSARQGVIKGAQGVLEFIGGVGEAIETITRFATFMTSMEAGRSIHESISDAKEISTNFARKGSGRGFTRDEVDRMVHADGTALKPIEKSFVRVLSTAVELCRASIPFFNAAVQGLNNKFTNYREHTGKTLLANSVYLLLGFGMSMLFRNGGGDDDEKGDYLHTSDYLRRNNILNPILGNGKYLKWALPQEYRFYYALGDILAGNILDMRPAEDAIADAVGSLMQLSPVGVITDEVLYSGGDKQTAWQNLILGVSPGVADPVFESLFNRDFKGARLYNQGFNENRKMYPGWTKAIETTGKEYVSAMEQLNKVHILDKNDRGERKLIWIADEEQNAERRGTFNFNPAVVEHLVESYFSGPYQIVVRVPEAVAKGVKGELKVRDVPLLNRIILNTNDNKRDAYYSNMYYYFKEYADEADRLDSDYEKTSPEHRKEVRESTDFKYTLVFKKYSTMESQIKKAKKLAQGKGDLDKVQEYDNQLEQIHYRIAKECLDIYFNRNGVK